MQQHTRQKPHLAVDRAQRKAHHAKHQAGGEKIGVLTEMTRPDPCHRHLPIVEQGRLMGIISMRDAIAAVLQGREDEIQGIENYALASGFQG